MGLCEAGALPWTIMVDNYRSESFHDATAIREYLHHLGVLVRGEFWRRRRPFQVAVSAGVNQLSISWSASAGAAGYKVYREIAGAYVLLDTVPGTTFSDSWKTADTWGQAFGNGYGRLGLPRGVAQNYRVTAYDDVGESIGVAASGTTVSSWALHHGQGPRHRQFNREQHRPYGQVQPHRGTDQDGA